VGPCVRLEHQQTVGDFYQTHLFDCSGQRQSQHKKYISNVDASNEYSDSQLSSIRSTKAQAAILLPNITQSTARCIN
jgi:hypothetical protein